MHFSRLLTIGILPQLSYALHIPVRRGVNCGFSTSANSGATCESLASSWGLDLDTLKALNPGIRCPNIDTNGFYCVVGTVTDDDPSPARPSSTAPVSTKAQPSSTNTAVKPTTLTKATTTAKPSPTKPSGNGVETPSPIQDGMVGNCNKFHPVRSTTTCKGILDYNKISLKDFVKWNPDVKEDCSNLWQGTHACVGVIGSSPSPTATVKPSPTKAGNGISTPSPIQDNMVSNCNKFHPVKSTTTCQGILEYNKISLADFVKWNPDVGEDCSNLWQGTNACVGVIGFNPTPTQAAGNGVKTPSPIQTGMVKNCVKFHHIRPTTTCRGVLDYNKITMEQFFKWNAAVKSDCSGLWKDTHACVGIA
ncbi:Ff.00g039930.m01.CDS01 [Fusarium sp. VM40]|nr:Ff.00g039930.m01.CDS01 [Fusarium sp. VM40]